MWICVLFALDMYIVCVIIQVQWESKMPYEADDIKDVALSALLEVAANNKAPAAARAAAARTMLEAIGAIGRLQDLARLDESKRSASEMSADEIAGEIARLTKKVTSNVRMRKMKI